MALKDKIRNWEIELEKTRKARSEAIEKFNKKEKMLLEKIEDARERIEIENNKAVGDIVREVYGELTEENILKFKELMKNTVKKSSDISDRL